MVRNAKDDYYRFPGGEIRSGETNISALAGRLREETGLIVSPGTETEYGCVVCRSRSETGGILLREVFYYICRTEPYRVPVRVNSAPSRESLSLCFCLSGHCGRGQPALLFLRRNEDDARG